MVVALDDWRWIVFPLFPRSEREMSMIQKKSDLWFMKVVQSIVNLKRGFNFRLSFLFCEDSHRFRISIDNFSDLCRRKESDDRWANKRSTEKREKNVNWGKVFRASSSCRINHNIWWSGTWLVVCNKLPGVAQQKKIRKWRLNAFLRQRSLTPTSPFRPHINSAFYRTTPQCASRVEVRFDLSILIILT